MNLGVISRRFLFSKKSHSLVNLVAIVSTVAIAVPTAAMVIVLSLQNGLSELVHSVYGAFDPQLKITPIEGQYFTIDSTTMHDLREFATVSEVIEGSVVAQWNDQRVVATLKGVDSVYAEVSGVKSATKRGRWQTLNGDIPLAVLGSGVSYNLALALHQNHTLLQLTALNATPSNYLIPLSIPITHSAEIMPIGVFAIEASIDSKYIITDIGFARELLSRNNQVSALELKPHIKLDDAIRRTNEIIEGSDLNVESQYDQRRAIYSAIEAEKLIILVVLIFVGAIAAMSLAGCVVMMRSEKDEAVRTLQALGLSKSSSRRIFIHLGMWVVAIGVVVGLVLGVGLSLLQSYLGVVATPGESLVVDIYPIKVVWSDIVAAALSMCALGYIIIQLSLGRRR